MSPLYNIQYAPKFPLGSSVDGIVMDNGQMSVPPSSSESLLIYFVSIQDGLWGQRRPTITLQLLYITYCMPFVIHSRSRKLKMLLHTVNFCRSDSRRVDICEKMCQVHRTEKSLAVINPRAQVSLATRSYFMIPSYWHSKLQ